MCEIASVKEFKDETINWYESCHLASEIKGYEKKEQLPLGDSF